MSLKSTGWVAVLAALVGSLSAQGGAPAPAPGAPQNEGIPPFLLSGKAEDPGVKVEMFESPGLDLFLRRAQDLLGKEDFDHAIKVLQAIVEGRTSEFLDPEEEKKRKAEAEAKAKKERENRRRGIISKEAAYEPPVDEGNPAYSVFSNDNRIFRPVSRLCHELLSTMPSEGVGLYRVKFEAAARQLYEKAKANHDLAGLEAVYNTYFATLSAAQAMRDAADLLMDAGRFRAAIQTLNSLLEVYPEPARKEAGVRDLLLMVKLAICYQQLGELDLAQAQLAVTAQAFPEDSVRLMGELRTVKDLHADPLFDASSLVVPTAKEPKAVANLRAAAAFVPLWEFRYTVPAPYTVKGKSSSRSSFRSRNGKPIYGSKFPRPNKYSPGTSVLFTDEHLVFLDSYRPIVCELTTGRMRLAMGSPDLATFRFPVSTVVPGARNPTYDYFANRVVVDRDRFYALQGYTKTSTSNPFRALQDNRLVAYDRRTGESIWESDSRANRKRPITFLATPTIHRRNLLLPFLDSGSYGLLCMDAATGSEIYRTYLHYKGTAFHRAPSAPVVVDSGVAYVLTNAGVLAAVDANTGILSWSRKYERVHPLRGPRRKGRPNSRTNMFGRGYVQPSPTVFRGFVPSDLLVVGDLIIVSAADSTVLECLNAATGGVVWLHNADRPAFHDVLADKLRYVIGHNGDNLFVMCGDAQLLCIGIKSGLRKWLVQLPDLEAGDWAGRGCVHGDLVVLPGREGTRKVYVIPADAKTTPKVHIVEMPALSVGREPLRGPANLFMNGAFFAACYADGVELYSTRDALATLADQSDGSAVKAGYLTLAGELRNAVDLLLGRLEQLEDDSAERKKTVRRTLGLAEELSLELAKNGEGAAALKLLDRCQEQVRDIRYVRRIHLFRLQVYRELGDLEGIEREQEFIESGAIKK